MHPAIHCCANHDPRRLRCASVSQRDRERGFSCSSSFGRIPDRLPTTFPPEAAVAMTLACVARRPCLSCFPSSARASVRFSSLSAPRRAQHAAAVAPAWRPSSALDEYAPPSPIKLRPACPSPTPLHCSNTSSQMGPARGQTHQSAPFDLFRPHPDRIPFAGRCKLLPFGAAHEVLRSSPILPDPCAEAL